MSGKEAAESGSAFALGDLHKIIDSLAQLFLVVWEKSPALGVLIIALVVFWPFYLVYTWGNVKRLERMADERVSDAFNKRKGKGKAKKGGKSK